MVTRENTKSFAIEQLVTRDIDEIEGLRHEDEPMDNPPASAEAHDSANTS